MPRFLSPEWMAEASAAAATSPELAEASAGVHLVVQQVVTGGPDGDVRYVVSLSDGRARFGAGEAADADVAFTTDWETAVAVATGASSAQDAFASGRLRVRGDVTALLRHARALDGLHAVFAGLRERTTY
ncbi:MAG: SCP2 sterol-binding domain-containing protein [Actinobacteria bacterium]|nr:SCP2 sterol-binding domain-containing protein [Actinomycetota bacterium]